MKKLQLLIVALFLNCTNSTIHSSDQQANNTSPKLTIHTYKSDRDKDAIERIIDKHPATAGTDINMIENNFNIEKATQGVDLTKYNISPAMINQFKQSMEQSFTKVLRINDETTIGFANYSKSPTDLSGHIKMIGIHEKYQRKGYAQQILTLGMKNFKKEGFESVFITVHESNTAARSLYAKLGFKTYTNYNAPQNSGFIFLQKKL